VGLDNIDFEAARRRHIEVVYTPAAATDAVADLTIGMMIALTRDLLPADRAVRGGAFLEARNRTRSVELSGLTMGIIGMGRIGRAVGRRCRDGFHMPVLFHDIQRPGLLDFAAQALPLDDLLSWADVISLHVPLTTQTRGMIDARALARFKRGAYLINTARGAVVDAPALAAALHEGRLAGAAIDVFDPEPPPPDHPLVLAPGALLTPHLGSRTKNALRNMNAVVEDVTRVLRGQPALFPAPCDGNAG
jgi:D-3-phosphoglycerate dehydrogenase